MQICKNREEWQTKNKASKNQKYLILCLTLTTLLIDCKKDKEVEFRMIPKENQILEIKKICLIKKTGLNPRMEIAPLTEGGK